ncbi:nexilin isoform X1 [Petromyzon marinus]|uniref:nexilin isoform X1 n=1 Tax=Petromyzon marinus TaxID=7757 RepID=UPI003F70C988
MTEVAHKAERILASTGKPVQRTYVPRLSTGDDGEGDVVSRFEQNRQVREDRSRRRCNDERQKRNEQFRREKELNRRKQELKQLLASDDEEEAKPAQVKKTFVPKLSGTVKGKFAEMEKARAEDERKRAEEERRRRHEQDQMEKKKMQKELAKKLAEEQGGGSGVGADADSAAPVAAAEVNKTPGKLSVDFESLKRAEDEEALRRKEEEKKLRYEENRRSFRESKRRSYLAMDEEEEEATARAQAEKTALAVPGKLQLSFEELERQRREEERRRTEEEARRRLDEERRAYLEARKHEGEGGDSFIDDDGDEVESVSSEASSELRPGKLRLSFEEVERHRQQEERRRLEEARERLEEEKRALLEARRSMAMQCEGEDRDGSASPAGSASDEALPGKLKLSFEELERRRQEEETRKAEEEARRRLDEEKRSFVEARRSMALDDEDAQELRRGTSGSSDSLGPGRLEINFEELLRLKQEEEARQHDEDRRVKLEEEKRAMEEEKQHMEPDEVNESSETVSKEYEEIKTLKRTGTIKAKSLKSKFEQMEQLSGEEIRRKIAEERARRQALEQERHDLEAQDFTLEEEVSHPVRTVEAPCARRADMKARFAEMALAREQEARRRVDEQKMQRMRFEQQEIDAASLSPKEGEEEDGTPNGMGLNGPVVNDDDELTRSGAPWFKRPLKNTQVVDGEPVRFLVRIVGSPRPEVTWWFEGEPLEDGEEYQYVVRGEDTYCLYLPETFPDDEGEYMCKAVSPKGSAASTCILTIESKAGALAAVAVAEGEGGEGGGGGGGRYVADDDDDDDDDGGVGGRGDGDRVDVDVGADKWADGEGDGGEGGGGDGEAGGAGWHAKRCTEHL